MTGDPERPGLELLGSLIAEQRVGQPGPARERALAAAKADVVHAHVHLLDATYAALAAGEPRLAARLLAQCEASAPRDETWRRRIAACRAWLWTVDRLWYPGDIAAEIASTDGMPDLPVDRPGDEEARQVETTARDVHQLLSSRWQVEKGVRESPETALANLLAGAGEAESLPPFGRLVYGDLVHRAGGWEQADAVVTDLRRHLEGLEAGDGASRLLLACTFLVEGDWYATPGSSPEALGLDLATWSVPSPFLERRDLRRAAVAYDQADAWLAGVDQPRALGALALRRAVLASLSGDHSAQARFLERATADFTMAGDAAGRWLTVVHRLVADVALGRIAATRRLAGTSFDLEARGPIAALRTWGEEDGSASWTTGLGRILQRAAAGWDKQGDYARAELAFEMAVPLVPVSGAEAPATVLLGLAELERRNGFVVRALTRSRAAVAALPPVTEARQDTLDWSRQVYALEDVLMGQVAATATAAGIDVAALEWACTRLRELLALPGVPPAGSGPQVPRTVYEALAGLADVARNQLSFAEASASLRRGRQAATVGAAETAERWYEDALARLSQLPSLEGGTMAVVFLAGCDRFDEARARLRALLDAPGQSAEGLLAFAAVRAHDYPTALRLFGTEPDDSRSWGDQVDHAEAALGAGEVELAVALTDRAVRDFEERFGRLRRDADRVAISDDVQVASLYLLAARAQLARAQQLEQAEHSDAASDARARAFDFTDRARALALAALLADASDHTDDEELILAWRQATSEWQATHDRLYRAFVTAAGDEEVGRRIADVASAEEQLVEVEAGLEGQQERRRPGSGGREPASLHHIQEALPEGVALLEYQLVNRDLLVWTITSRSASAATSHHETGAIARLAKAVQRACTNGRPGPEAAELAEILLGPAATVADACDRLIIVPYGPLHGLPFHALPHRGRPLGETHVVSYLPAAALLRGAAVDEQLAGGRALVVGDPAFEPAVRPSLSRLPGAAVEAISVAETHGVRPLIGPEAAETTIRRDLRGCTLIHLAAHGRLDPIAPSDSSIVLAGRDELTVSDLVGLQLDSQLVVLSACDSGRGAASLGGDVVGLARGLLAAGARRSVVSLWPVDDAPACATMSLFHQHLAEGAPVARALHLAQQAVRALSGPEIAALYVELGGDAGETASSRRRGAPSADGGAALPLDPEFIDDLDDDEPIDELSGELARVWAPFVVIGI